MLHGGTHVQYDKTLFLRVYLFDTTQPVLEFRMEPSVEIMVCQVCDGYELAEDGFPKKLTKKHLIQILSTTDMRSRVLECYRQEHNIQLFHTFYDEADRKHSWEITFIPIRFEARTIVFLLLRNLYGVFTSTNPEQAVDEVRSYITRCIQAMSKGICGFEVLPNEKLRLIYQNDLYYSLMNYLSQENFSLDYLPEIVSSVRTRRVQNGIRRFMLQDGSELVVDFRIIPVLRRNQVAYLLVSWNNCLDEIRYIKYHNSGLTVRETQIIRYLVEGCTNRYISNKLRISEGTVKKTIYNLYQKLNVTSRYDILRDFLT